MYGARMIFSFFFQRQLKLHLPLQSRPAATDPAGAGRLRMGCREFSRQAPVEYALRRQLKLHQPLRSRPAATDPAGVGRLGMGCREFSRQATRKLNRCWSGKPEE